VRMSLHCPTTRYGSPPLSRKLEQRTSSDVTIPYTTPGTLLDSKVLHRIDFHRGDNLVENQWKDFDMRLLLHDDNLGPQSPGDSAEMDSEMLALAYAYPPLSAEQSWVRANFISTLDGAATGDDGHSGSINTGADREVFQLLRALSDVVLVGAGTARVEGYKRATVKNRWSALRKGRPAHPTTAVVSRSGDVPAGLSKARQDSGEVLMLTCHRAGAEAIDLARGALGRGHVIVAGEDTVDLMAAVDALAMRGLQRVLCEGGPHLMGDLTAVGRLDELCLTIAPILVAGQHPRITAGASAAVGLVPRLLIESQGSILGRWTAPD
jgi:riboflavin biosynthesis pyrimidine reductase